MPETEDEGNLVGWSVVMKCSEKAEVKSVEIAGAEILI